MKLDDRQYAGDKKLCYNCLSVGHVSSKCNSVKFKDVIRNTVSTYTELVNNNCS